MNYITKRKFLRKARMIADKVLIGLLLLSCIILACLTAEDEREVETLLSDLFDRKETTTDKQDDTKTSPNKSIWEQLFGDGKLPSRIMRTIFPNHVEPKESNSEWEEQSNILPLLKETHNNELRGGGTTPSLSVTTTSTGRDHTDSSRPSTGYTTNTAISEILTSPDLGKDLFTPTTYKCLEDEISKNHDNITNLHRTILDPDTQSHALEKLLEERSYLLDQKRKHLEGSLQVAKNKPMDDVDADNLYREALKLKDQAFSLFEKSRDNPRRLDIIKQEETRFKSDRDDV